MIYPQKARASSAKDWGWTLGHSCGPHLGLNPLGFDPLETFS